MTRSSGARVQYMWVVGGDRWYLGIIRECTFVVVSCRWRRRCRGLTSLEADHCRLVAMYKIEELALELRFGEVRFIDERIEGRREEAGVSVKVSESGRVVEGRGVIDHVIVLVESEELDVAGYEGCRRTLDATTADWLQRRRAGATSGATRAWYAAVR